MTTNEDYAAHLALKKKFEVGQIWLCRNDSKRLIISTTKPGDRPVVACFLCGGGVHDRTVDGRSSKAYESGEDLISLYTPKRTKDCWLVLFSGHDGSRLYFSCEEEHQPKLSTWTSYGWKVLAIKKVTVTEGEGIDWERE